MSNKRNLNDEEENPKPKRLCGSSPFGSNTVAIKLTLNQLFNSSAIRGLSKDANDGQNSGFDKKCFNCLKKCQSVWFSCNFCERNVCDECSLNCFRCLLTYCRLCAVKRYEFSHENNIGICLSCGP